MLVNKIYKKIINGDFVIHCKDIEMNLPKEISIKNAINFLILTMYNQTNNISYGFEFIDFLIVPNDLEIKFNSLDDFINNVTELKYNIKDKTIPIMSKEDYINKIIEHVQK